MRSMVNITFLQAILCGILYWLAIGNLPFVGLWTLQKPLVCGALVGLILGHPVEGAVIGGSINLMYIGFVSAGGSMPSDISLAGIVGTAYAITSGVSTKTALALSVPIGLLGVVVWTARMTVDGFFVHMADAYIEKEEYHKIWRANVLYPQIFCAAITILPCSLSVYYGSIFLSSKLALLDGAILSSFQVVGSLLPCLGIAITLTYIFEGEARIFFFLGFLLASYCNLPLHMMGVFSLIIGIIYMQMKGEEIARPDEEEEEDEDGEEEDENEDDEEYDGAGEYAGGDPGGEKTAGSGDKSGRMESAARPKVCHLIPRKALWRAWLIWETFPQTCYNYERMMGQEMAHMFVPLLKYLYKDQPQKAKELMKREITFYNTHVEFGACVSGMAIALEEQKAIQGQVSDVLIKNLKTSFMGSLAGMGDTIWQGIFIPVLLVFCIDLTNSNGGNVWGAVIYSILVILAAYTLSYYNFMFGYRFGGESIVRLLENGKLKRLLSVASITGCMVMGALVVKYVNCACGLSLTFSENTFQLQEELFDKICPNLIPLAMVMLIYYLIKKRAWSSKKVIVLCFLLGLLSGYTGILTAI